MDTNKPMALRLADKYEHEGFLSDHKFAQNQWCSHAAVELRRLHAENESLSNKLQTFEALGCAVDDLQLLRMGYDAARLEAASLKKTLEAYKQSGMDFAARAHALERAADNLREENASLQQRDDDWHKEHSNALVEVARLKAAKADARHDIDDLTARDESQRLRIAELEAQLYAIGAGGVEPLRKRECLHQIIEPAPSEWDVRGHLAESLTCWPRLTEQEAAELVALFDRRPYPPLPDCKYTQSGDIKDFGLYSTAQMLAYVAADRSACYEAQASPVDAELMRDAERYRWLRKSPNPACDIKLAEHFCCGRGEDFDAKIDAARAAQGGV